MKIKLIIVAAVTTLALTACGSQSLNQVSVQHVNVDGQSIPCIVWVGSQAGSISCNWK